MHDLRERIRSTRPDDAGLRPVDVEALVRRGRRRAIVERSSAAVAVVGLLVGGSVVFGAVQPPGGLEIEPAEPASPTATASEDTTSGSSAGRGWPELTLDEAIEALIAANREAAPHPTPGPGQLLVQRTSSIYTSGVVESDQSTSFTLEVGRYETRTDADGATEIVRTTFGTVEPTDSLDDLRAAAAPYFENPPEGTDERFAGTDPQRHAEEALREAEADSRGSAEPVPGQTERPDQAHAFMRAADALRVGLQPADRIRALEAIGRIDDSLVEYRGEVQDLLGREGIAIAGRDGDWWGTPEWHVLIFDRETGDLLGEYQELVRIDHDAPPIMSYTARETFLVDRDGTRPPAG